MQGFTDINYDNSPKVIVINHVKLTIARESTIHNALENNSRFYRISC